MSKIIIANWKNHPETLEQAKELLEFSANEAAKYPNIKIIICPPGKFLLPITNFLGAQDVFWSKSEEAPEKVKYVLVGHSDRRYPLAGGGDTDEIINQKLKLALSAGITPVLLVGEKERGDNRQEVLEEQLSGALLNLSTSDVDKLMVTYEPVWAISTNPNAESDTAEDTLEALKIIQKFLSTNYLPAGQAGQLPITCLPVRQANYQFLYGGSITDKNVADFLKHSEIGGAVIGGASLRKEEFANILKIVSEL